jgi:hypothetical protein
MGDRWPAFAQAQHHHRAQVIAVKARLCVADRNPFLTAAVR